MDCEKKNGGKLLALEQFAAIHRAPVVRSKSSRAFCGAGSVLASATSSI